RKTYFSDGANLGSSESLAAVKAVVASPILDHKGEVKGAVYGIRDKASRDMLGQISIGNLEAQMVRLLASTVAVGMARLETAANFEAFFGSELALELENNPALLTGREREISVLFADIRGFSRFSQALGPSETCKLVGDVMEKLSQCVRDQKGVIVSYMGDGILAMWNAPQEQPDHAMRAVRAGQAMINCLGETNQTWSGRTGGLKVGVGISSGPASCGNTGSSFKFQYGPLGNTVNVASRVEGATKHFGVSMLVTASTRALLDEKVPVRRVRKVMLKGIPEAVDLYEVPESSGGAELGDFIKRYELSLKHYEEGRHLEAVKGLQNLLANAAEPDGPTLALLMRAVAALGQIEQGSPVEEMQGK
ncbi:MAG: adenylate/guanylate cyclase domain-containing protein, partial [Planctomycetota bacterium]